MENPFILGPIQKEWIKSLREHPERQMTSRLGYGTPDDYRACCLGELHVIGCKVLNEPPPFERGCILSCNFGASLIESYSRYGLHSPMGGFATSPIILKLDDGEKIYSSLADMNDNGVSWPNIANFIEQNSRIVFTLSV